MPNLVKVTQWEKVQDQAEKEGLFVVSKLVEEVVEVQEQSHVRQMVPDPLVELCACLEQHVEQCPLASGEETKQKEEVMSFFDELPSFVEQAEENLVLAPSLQQLRSDLFDEAAVKGWRVQENEVSQNLKEDCFDSIIEDFCVKFDNLKQEVYEQHENLIQGPNFFSLEEATLMFEYFPSFIVEERHASECSSLSNNEDFKIEPNVASISQVDSLDNILDVLTEDDSPLTGEEELTWKAIMQESHDEPPQGKEASRERSQFNISRGCPIKHLARMEAVTERLVEPAAEHETYAVDDAFSAELEQFQLIPPSLDNSAFDQTNKRTRPAPSSMISSSNKLWQPEQANPYATTEKSRQSLQGNQYIHGGTQKGEKG